MAHGRKINSKYQLISFLLLLCILATYAFFAKQEETSPFTVDGKGIYVHFIDVGQGDAALVQTKDGNLLIDAGTPDSTEALLGYIDALDLDTLEYAIFTHPHSDHIGGATRLLKAYSFQNIVLPDAVSTSYSFEKMIDAIEAENCNVIEGKAGVSFQFGDTQVELLAPVLEHGEEELNNASVVAKVTYGTVSFLFTGDAEQISENEMLERDAEALDSDILKVGHHGSSTSSSKDFLRAVSPEVAIVSAGQYNENGHPHTEVVNRLNSIGAKLYRTDKCGSIVVYTDGNTYVVQTEK